nr:MAG TPA: hypothetical protein [Caudoviricetes sp.]
MIGLDLIGGFCLAVKSIEAQYLGGLACWTVVSTPIGTAATIVLNSIVNKSKAENSNNGKGIVYAAAESCGFNNSPEI